MSPGVTTEHSNTRAAVMPLTVAVEGVDCHDSVTLVPDPLHFPNVMLCATCY